MAPNDSRFTLGIATRSDSRITVSEKYSDRSDQKKNRVDPPPVGLRAYISALHRHSQSTTATFRSAGRILLYTISPVRTSYLPPIAPCSLADSNANVDPFQTLCGLARQEEHPQTALREGQLVRSAAAEGV